MRIRVPTDLATIQLFQGTGRLPMLRRQWWIVLLGTWLIGGSGRIMAADVAKIDAGLKNGIKWLLENQREDGSWEYIDSESRSLGATTLGALALYENGISRTDPRFRKAMAYVREKARDNTDTYSVSLATILLSRVNEHQDHALIRALAAKLVAGQLQTGAWGYTVPKLTFDQERDPALRKPPAAGLGDLSVTQFAVLALWQARRHGARVDDALRLVRQRLAWAQAEDGGWSYHILPDERPSQSMTTAGSYLWILSSVAEIVEAQRRDQPVVEPKQPRKPKESLRDKTRREMLKNNEPQEKIDEALKKIKDPPPADIYDALQRSAIDHKIAQEKKAAAAAPAAQAPAPATAAAPATGPGSIDYLYTPTVPPVVDITKPTPLQEDPVLTKGLARTGTFVDASLPNGTLYWLWSVERLGVLLGREKLGKTDWYTIGSNSILKKQNPDGSWGRMKEPTTDNKERAAFDQQVPETAFALLFLRKANLGSDVTRLIIPESKTPFLLGEPGSKTTPFASLAEAVKAAKPQDTIEIHGDGPFTTGGVVIDKPLTIRAFGGFKPTLRYAWPKDKAGIDQSLSENPNATTVVTITASPVTLEGLHFQIDPPYGVKNDWVALRSRGASLRLLNCTFSEASRPDAVALSTEGTRHLLLRNTLFSGFGTHVRLKTEEQTNVLFKDCIAYGPRMLEAVGSGELNVWLIESTLHVNDGFDFGSHKGTVTQVVENNVIRCANLIAAMPPGGRKSATWDGQFNFYDVRIWINRGDAASSDIDGIKAWRSFWKVDETSSVVAIAPFDIYRPQMGPYRHDVTPQEWSIDEDKIEHVMHVSPQVQVGGNVPYIGAGPGYLQFRDSSEYENWRKIQIPSERTVADQN